MRPSSRNSDKAQDFDRLTDKNNMLAMTKKRAATRPRQAPTSHYIYIDNVIIEWVLASLPHRLAV